MPVDKKLLHSTLCNFVSPHDINLERTVTLIQAKSAVALYHVLYYTIGGRNISMTIDIQTFKFKLPLLRKKLGTNKTGFHLLFSYSLRRHPHYKIFIVCQIILNSSARRNVTIEARIMHTIPSIFMYFFRIFRFSQKDMPIIALNQLSISVNELNNTIYCD
jgi:hypothetical protein